MSALFWACRVNRVVSTKSDEKRVFIEVGFKAMAGRWTGNHRVIGFGTHFKGKSDVRPVDIVGFNRTLKVGRSC